MKLFAFTTKPHPEERDVLLVDHIEEIFDRKNRPRWAHGFIDAESFEAAWRKMELHPNYKPWEL
ncbi:MAG: hypothetical protein LBR88_01145 [Zoogloeaceae bacterium]|jgi:hypothetical protein|nr:hypothetical protein [Zoogloeaceae bacterium]